MPPEIKFVPKSIEATNPKQSLGYKLGLAGGGVFGAGILIGVLILIIGLGLSLKDTIGYWILIPTIKETPDKIISSFQCGTSPYTWTVLEKDAVAKGNSFEIGSEASIYTYRDLLLLQGDENVAKVTELYNGYFSPGAPFIKSVIGSQSVFDLWGYGYGGNNYYTSIEIPQSKMSVQDFDTVANCLFENHLKLNEDLGENDKYYKQIGWITLMDDSVKRDRDDLWYWCADGRTIAVNGMNVEIHSDDPSKQNLYSNYISLDGKIHANKIESLITPGGTDPAELFPNCTDATGETLVDYLHSIPDRISFYE